MKTPHESLELFPVVISFPVHWGDQDPLSHVNNIVYLRWAESARIEYLSRTGIWDGLAIATTGPILAAISCDFRLPVTYPDTVYAGARITAIGNSSFKMEHRIVSGKRGVVAADLDSTLVWFDYRTAKSAALPPEVRKAIEDLEGKPLPRITRNNELLRPDPSRRAAKQVR
jgi:acyl-CoA thioester hydrolase